MAEQCVFCQDQIESSHPSRLEKSKMFMFEILMEQTTFDAELFADSPMCQDCDKTISSFFEFKSNFMEAEDEFINYMNPENKVDLYSVQVKMLKLKRFENESLPIKVCRICFKATQIDRYKDITSLASDVATMVTTCLPELNIKLTDRMYLCPECHSVLLQYYNFLMSCSKVSKSRKRASSDISESLTLETEDKRQKLDENEPIVEPIGEPLSPSSLLIPVAPPKRGRGRPRKTSPKLSLLQIILRDRKHTSKNKSYSTSNESYECQICPDVLYNFTSLTNHIAGHEEEKGFFCWYCGNKRYSFRSLCKHYASHDLGPFKIVKEDGAADKDSSGMPQHNNNRSLSKNKTEAEEFLSLIRKMYVSPNKRKQAGRKKSKAVPVRSFNTSVASAAATSSTTLNEDQLETKYECQVCPGAFDTLPNLREHILFHGKQTEIVCWRCGAWFLTLPALKQHFETHGLTNLYKVVNPKTNQSTAQEEIVLLSTTHSQTVRDQSTSPEPNLELASSIPCPLCKQNFDGIEGYMNHSCSYTKPSEDLKEQEFGCGHCSAVFYSLDDLDEHDCISSTDKVNFAVGGLGHPRGVSRAQTKYKCAYCFQTFTTPRLDTHVCKEESENTASSTTTNSAQVQKENLFECSYCLNLFETSLELNRHNCSSALSPTPGGAEAIPATDGISRLIKPEPECDWLLSPEFAIELGTEKKNKNAVEAQSDKNVSDDSEIVGGYTDDVLKSKNVSRTNLNGAKKPKKKAVINEIPQGQKAKVDHKCVGCDFRGTDPTDLMFHFGSCDKVFRCNFCTYGTNIPQKLEIHSWAAHDMLVFVCFYCTFVTSMEENYEAHVSTHQKFIAGTKTFNTIDDISQDNILTDVQCISDKEDSACLESVLGSNSAQNNPSDMLNQLFDILGKERGCGWQDVSGQEKGGELQHKAARSNQSDTIVINTQQTILSNTEVSQDVSSEETLSVDQPWLDDSDDSIALQISQTEAPAAVGDLLATEPVWLVKTTFINDNVPQPELPDKTASPEDSCASQNESELIIPDRISLDPTNIEAETSEEPSKVSDHVPASTTYIQCDSDSDSEFVESSETKISNTAARAEGVCTISASEASKLISEGVPVISNSNLVPLQMKYFTSTVGSTDNQTSIPVQLNPVITQQNEGQVHKASEDSSTISTYTDKESTNTNNEMVLLLESTKQSLGDNEDSPVTSSDKKEPVKEDRRKSDNETDTIEDAREESNEAAVEKNKSKVQISVEENESDGSSFFATDNDDSDIDDNEEAKTESKNENDPVKQHHDPDKRAGKSFLPVHIEEGVLISDDEDNSGKEKPEQNLTSPNVTSTGKKGCEGQTTKNSMPKSVLLTNNIASKTVPSTSPKNVSNLAKTPTVDPEDSFVISDDEDSCAGTETGKPETRKPASQVQAIADYVKTLNPTGKKKSYFMTAKTAAKKLTVGVKCATQKKIIKKTASVTKEAPVISQNPCVVIEDDDEEDTPSGSGSSSGKNVSSEEGAKEADEDSADDCVFVSAVDGIRQSKNLGATTVKKVPVPPKDGLKVKAPPNSLNLFISKVKSNIKQKYPHLNWSAQKNVILGAWRHMSSEEKWPFKEEARLHRVLFKREHPELVLRKKKVKKPPPVQTPIISEVVEEIELD